MHVFGIGGVMIFQGFKFGIIKQLKEKKYTFHVGDLHYVGHNSNLIVATPLWRSVRMTLTLPKWGLGSPPGLPKTQNSIAGVKTPRLEVFFIPLERSWSVDVENGLTWAIWTYAATSYVRKKIVWPLVVWLPTTKSRELTRFTCVQAVCDILLERFRWGLQLCFKPHRDRRSAQEIMRLQSFGSPAIAILGLPFGSLETKSHLDMAPMERRRVYYMGEGGGFPRVRAVVSQVSPELPVVCPSTKGVPKCELTNLLVGLMQVRVSE